MMTKLSISHKILLGYSLVLVFLIAIAAISISTMSSAEQGFIDYRSLARNTNNAGRIQANLLSVKIAALHFILSADDNALNAEKRRFALLKELIGSAKLEAINSEQLNTFKNIDALLDKYAETFEDIEHKIRFRQSLVKDNLNVLGPRMERQLTEILVSAREDDDMEAAYFASLAMRNLLLARLYVVKFLDTHGNEEVDRVTQEFKQFSLQLTQLDIELQNEQRRALLSQIAKDSLAYVRTFESLKKPC